MMIVKNRFTDKVIGGFEISPRADLSDANLFGANLFGADLFGAENQDYLIAITSILPDAGDVIGWKKCNYDVIVKLSIGSDTPRSNSTGRKCRAKFATVLEVIGGDVGISSYDEKTEYRAGEVVTCDEWNENRWIECGGGIHFFITRYEAEHYN